MFRSGEERARQTIASGWRDGGEDRQLHEENDDAEGREIWVRIAPPQNAGHWLRPARERGEQCRGDWVGEKRRVHEDRGGGRGAAVVAHRHTGVRAEARRSVQVVVIAISGQRVWLVVRTVPVVVQMANVGLF
jgi:hypothetical protein